MENKQKASPKVKTTTSKENVEKNNFDRYISSMENASSTGLWGRQKN
jgi:hypothetical protein